MLVSTSLGKAAMRISRKDLAAMSPAERERVLAEMAHPAKAAKNPKGSPLASLLHALSSLIPTGRASQ
jgi:hypothetical protein